MKKTIQFLSLVVAMIFSTVALAQDAPKFIGKSVVESLNKTPNYGFGVSAERAMRSAFMMYDKMKKSGVEINNYEIVIWGMVVRDIKEDKELFDFLSKYSTDGLKVTVCSVAMNRLGIEKEDLPKGFEVVDDAYVRIFELQALGYNVLIP
ncbi:DsrE family protein [Brumimicrobium mesophilum]|uniref:DsrE family protein n=1 Tax=Brumimicrobium mesophilum TaxID=392717 RepID=UPI000D143B5E|nr:DsrE family protein [Brumimicrobium mesophilum]